MKKIIFLWVAVIILSGVAIYTVSKYQNSEPIQSITPTASNSLDTSNPSPSVENTNSTNIAPDFTLQNLDGDKVSLSDYKGKKVFLNFWATWCPPCKAEMPDMQEVYEETKNNDIVILAVNIGDSQKDVKQFIDERGFEFPVLLDLDQQVAKVYDITAIPTSYFIDKNGAIINSIRGAMSKNDMLNYINSLD